MEHGETLLEIVCAWCGRVTGTKPGHGSTGVTSTICERCEAKTDPTNCAAGGCLVVGTGSCRSCGVHVCQTHGRELHLHRVDCSERRFVEKSLRDTDPYELENRRLDGRGRSRWP